MTHNYEVIIHNAEDDSARTFEIYDSYEDALAATINHRDELEENEYFAIIETEYDNNGNEMGVCYVYNEAIYDSMQTLKEVLLNSVAEFEGYLEDDDHDNLEKHDCRIFIEAYKSVLDSIARVEAKEV
jgi:hypothetical protein